jgi:putative IMPACT (imprinted ancient) family translation regulator
MTGQPSRSGIISPIHHGERFTIKKSVFQGHAAHITTVDQVGEVKKALLAQKRISKATHHIFAYKLHETTDADEPTYSNNIAEPKTSDEHSRVGSKRKNKKRKQCNTRIPGASDSNHLNTAPLATPASGRWVRGSDDDGEGGASEGLARLLDNHHVRSGAVVFVTRWYGGVQLGPQRFRAINTAGKQALDLLLESSADK